LRAEFGVDRIPGNQYDLEAQGDESDNNNNMDSNMPGSNGDNDNVQNWDDGDNIPANKKEFESILLSSRRKFSILSFLKLTLNDNLMLLESYQVI
jgi:hypothetical protein